MFILQIIIAKTSRMRPLHNFSIAKVRFSANFQIENRKNPVKNGRPFTYRDPWPPTILVFFSRIRVEFVFELIFYRIVFRFFFVSVEPCDSLIFAPYQFPIRENHFKPDRYYTIIPNIVYYRLIMVYVFILLYYE